MIKGKLEGKKGAALADLAARLSDLDARQERAQAEGVPALRRLVAVAQRDTGQSRIVGRFLLGLWNGSAYGFDLTELRGLDTALHDDCLAVLRLDHTPAREVHQYIEDGDRVWERLRECSEILGIESLEAVKKLCAGDPARLGEIVKGII